MEHMKGIEEFMKTVEIIDGIPNICEDQNLPESLTAHQKFYLSTMRGVFNAMRRRGIKQLFVAPSLP